MFKNIIVNTFLIMIVLIIFHPISSKAGTTEIYGLQLDFINVDDTIILFDITDAKILREDETSTWDLYINNTLVDSDSVLNSILSYNFTLNMRVYSIRVNMENSNATISYTGNSIESIYTKFLIHYDSKNYEYVLSVYPNDTKSSFTEYKGINNNGVHNFGTINVEYNYGDNSVNKLYKVLFNENNGVLLINDKDYKISSSLEQIEVFVEHYVDVTEIDSKYLNLGIPKRSFYDAKNIPYSKEEIDKLLKFQTITLTNDKTNTSIDVPLSQDLTVWKRNNDGTYDTSNTHTVRVVYQWHELPKKPSVRYYAVLGTHFKYSTVIPRPTPDIVEYDKYYLYEHLGEIEYEVQQEKISWDDNWSDWYDGKATSCLDYCQSQNRVLFQAYTYEPWSEWTSQLPVNKDEVRFKVEYKYRKRNLEYQHRKLSGYTYGNWSRWSYYSTLNYTSDKYTTTYERDVYSIQIKTDFFTGESYKVFYYKERTRSRYSKYTYTWNLSSYLSGWTRTGSTRYSSWSSWSDWSETNYSESKYREVQSRTLYSTRNYLFNWYSNKYISGVNYTSIIKNQYRIREAIVSWSNPYWSYNPPGNYDNFYTKGSTKPVKTRYTNSGWYKSINPYLNYTGIKRENIDVNIIAQPDHAVNIYKDIINSSKSSEKDILANASTIANGETKANYLNDLCWNNNNYINWTTIKYMSTYNYEYYYNLYGLNAKNRYLNSNRFVPYIYVNEHWRADVVVTEINIYEDSIYVLNTENVPIHNSEPINLTYLYEPKQRNIRVRFFDYNDPFPNSKYSELPLNWEGHNDLIQRIKSSTFNDIDSKVILTQEDIKSIRYWLNNGGYETLGTCALLHKFDYLFSYLSPRTSLDELLKSNMFCE